MRKDELFGGREQKSLDALGSSIRYVYDSMKPTLDEALKAQSVVNDSLGVINNNSVGVNDSDFSQGQSDARAKVRVLTPNNRPVVKDNYNEVSNNFSNNNYGFNAGSSAGDQGFVNSNYTQSGSAQTLILIFTAILVVMIVLVSLVILKFLGI